MLPDRVRASRMVYLTLQQALELVRRNCKASVTRADEDHGVTLELHSTFDPGIQHILASHPGPGQGGKR